MVYLLAVMLTSVLLFELNPVLIQLLATTAIIFFMVVISFFSASYSKVRSTPQYFLKELILLPDNIVELNKQQYEMGLNSRVGIFGCWLCLSCEKDNKVKSETHFIFKSSVSDYHYSQLCRVIKRNAFHAD
ncbi:hypothetical protein ACM9HF_16745 [Colwellia sp. RE-S-Sl-9]